MDLIYLGQPHCKVPTMPLWGRCCKILHLYPKLDSSCLICVSFFSFKTDWVNSGWLNHRQHRLQWGENCYLRRFRYLLSYPKNCKSVLFLSLGIFMPFLWLTHPKVIAWEFQNIICLWGLLGSNSLCGWCLAWNGSVGVPGKCYQGNWTSCSCLFFHRQSGSCWNIKLKEQ